MKPAFTKVNRYIFDPKAISWSIPSGTTCPGAEKCLAKVDRVTGKITNGVHQEYKCYSAMTERYPSVRERYWTNFEAVRGKSAKEVHEVLSNCFPKNAKRVRIHTAGDYFSQSYFDGWLLFIASRPDIQFWAFTKSLPFWIARLGLIPKNLELQASYGGRHDHLIEQHNLKFAKVVWSVEEANLLGLEIDLDDRLAAYPGKSFALLENFSAKKKGGSHE
jgi:hypothetical protein